MNFFDTQESSNVFKKQCQKIKNGSVLVIVHGKTVVL